MIPVDRHPQDAAEVRAILARRVACDPSCRGWFVDGETLRVTACDACRVDWTNPSTPRELYDDDVQLLPEARAARVQAVCISRTRGRQIYAVTRRAVQRTDTLRRVMNTLVVWAAREARWTRDDATRPDGRSTTRGRQIYAVPRQNVWCGTRWSMLTHLIEEALYQARQAHAPLASRTVRWP